MYEGVQFGSITVEGVLYQVISDLESPLKAYPVILLVCLCLYANLINPRKMVTSCQCIISIW